MRPPQGLHIPHATRRQGWNGFHRPTNAVFSSTPPGGRTPCAPTGCRRGGWRRNRGRSTRCCCTSCPSGFPPCIPGRSGIHRDRTSRNRTSGRNSSTGRSRAAWVSARSSFSYAGSCLLRPPGRAGRDRIDPGMERQSLPSMLKERFAANNVPARHVPCLGFTLRWKTMLHVHPNREKVESITT